MQRFNRLIDRWLTAPEPNAARRLCLYRVLFSVYYLWEISDVYGRAAGELGQIIWRPIIPLSFLSSAPPPLMMELIESLLVASLVLLLVGFRVRTVTVAVLVLGLLFEGTRMSYGRAEHAGAFMVFYIPLLMLFSGWGATYSLDALLSRRSGRQKADPYDSHWRYSLPIRGTLLIFAVLFITATVHKARGGDWLDNTNLIVNLFDLRNVEMTLYGLGTVPGTTLVKSMPLLADVLRWGVLVFEATFVLSLFSRRLFYGFFLPLALLFHATNALALGITFTPILIAYALFVDWQSVSDRLGIQRLRWRTRLARVPSAALVLLTLAAAFIVVLLWNDIPVLRQVISVGGLLNWRSIWLPVALVTVGWWVGYLVNGVRGLLRSSPKPAEGAAEN